MRKLGVLFLCLSVAGAAGEASARRRRAAETDGRSARADAVVVINNGGAGGGAAPGIAVDPATGEEIVEAPVDQPAPRPRERHRAFALGLRGTAGGSVGPVNGSVVGSGVYARWERGRYGLEVGLDNAIVRDFFEDFSRTPLTFSGLYYFNPNGRVRVYGLAGAGMAALQDATPFVRLDDLSLIFQAGAGVAVPLYRRLSLETDLREVVDSRNGLTTALNVGVALHF
jgi:hypothetical protein